MDHESVSAALQGLRGLDFPRSPADPDLGDWIMDLLEADAFYAGTAASVVAGSPFTRPPRDELDELTGWLSELRVPSPEDQVILDQCHAYLAGLRRLHQALQS
jgi:hypothetical protein